MKWEINLPPATWWTFYSRGIVLRRQRSPSTSPFLRIEHVCADSRASYSNLDFLQLPRGSLLFTNTVEGWSQTHITNRQSEDMSMLTNGRVKSIGNNEVNLFLTARIKTGENIFQNLVPNSMLKKDWLLVDSGQPHYLFSRFWVSIHMHYGTHCGKVNGHEAGVSLGWLPMGSCQEEVKLASASPTTSLSW